MVNIQGMPPPPERDSSELSYGQMSVAEHASPLLSLLPRPFILSDSFFFTYLLQCCCPVVLGSLITSDPLHFCEYFFLNLFLHRFRLIPQISTSRLAVELDLSFIN